MSSGEADAAYAAKALLARSRSLDAFTRCTGLGCEVMVHLSGNGRCHLHGGASGIAEYMSSAGDGSLIWSRHITLNLGSDCE